MSTSDNTSIDELHLSVMVERACEKHGIKTIGQLREKLSDLKSIGLSLRGGKRHERAIRKALAEWESRPVARKKLVDAAKAAVLALTEEERRDLHCELGLCACAEVARTFGEHPAMAAGAAIGAFVGAMLAPTKAKKSGGV